MSSDTETQLDDAPGTYKPRTLRDTEARKAKFLEAFRQTNGAVAVSAGIAEVQRSTPYSWRKTDPAFAQEWDEISGVTSREAEAVRLTNQVEKLHTDIVVVPDFSGMDTSSSVVMEATREARKKAFVDVLRVTGIKADAVKAAGVTRRACEMWRADDDEFARQWDDALDDYFDHVVLREAHSRGVEGKSDRVLLALLRSHYPRFRDQQDINVRTTGKVLVEWSDGEIARRALEMARSLNIVDGEFRELGPGADDDGP